jgi:hypothetical protein
MIVILLCSYESDVPDISNLIRDYVDTSREALLQKSFDHDHWGLTDILKAADRRIGKRRLAELREMVRNDAALKVIDARLC